jgi:hypothetical protein
MPLQLPNLDDRRYADLVAEALALIPTLAPPRADAPGWTNYNPSDPGITLVELFAYLADMLLYRLNRVTDDNRRKFLQLLNGPQWPQSASADLRDEIRDTVLRIRERYRAVTREDYEFLATETFNQSLLGPPPQASLQLVARAHCVPQRNLEAGTEDGRLAERPEHVSVVIVPAPQQPNPKPPPQVVTTLGGGPNPQPSAAQIGAVFSFLDPRRMLTTKLHVVGPFYVHVTAQIVIARTVDAVDADLTAAVTDGLRRFLDPLPSDDGDGWPFGRDVFVSEIYELLEQIPGIDFITDVMLGSTCAPGDDKCIAAEPLWHQQGDFVGLKIEDHHLPVFDHADVVIAPNAAFVTVELTVSAQAQANADRAALRRAIKSAVRGIFHPGLGGPGPATAQPTSIFVSDVLVAIKNISGVAAASLAVECTPSDILQHDPNRGNFIHVDARHVVDWRVAIQLS